MLSSLDMKTKAQKYLYFRDGEPCPKEIAFNDAFRHYCNFYFHNLKPLFPLDSPGYQQLSECKFQNPIEEEARGPLAQILGLERPITYEPERFEPFKGRLVGEYKAHHLFLRSVRKFYKSRLVVWNATFNDHVGGLVEGKKLIDLHQKVPLATSLQQEYQQLLSLNPPTKYIKKAQQPASLQNQMENSLYPDQSHWPADIIDIHFFLERGNFRIPDLNQALQYGNIRDCLHSVAEDVDLLEKLKEYRDSAYIYVNDQETLNRHIVSKYEDREVQEAAASVARCTLETDPAIQEHETREQGSSSYYEARSPLTGSLSMAHGLGVGPVMPAAPLGLSLVILGGYLGFKIYEFFVPQKETSTNLKDCLFKCGEHKISKETTFEPTLIKLELNSNDKPRNCTEKLY